MIVQHQSKIEPKVNEDGEIVHIIQVDVKTVTGENKTLSVFVTGLDELGEAPHGLAPQTRMTHYLRAFFEEYEGL